jgi:tetratricopeptide (TPR) repeat protein
MTAFSRASIELIPEWLAATRDVDIATGLSREEALLRARKLRHLIREGKVSPKDVELDEDGKDVLYALVKLLTESRHQPGADVTSEANAICLFLRRVEWPAAGFEEKAELLRWCAQIGWMLSGRSFADVHACRAVSVPNHLIAVRLMHSKATPAIPSVEITNRFREYLKTDAGQRDLRIIQQDPDFAIGILNFLSSHSSKEPRLVASEASWLYRVLESTPQSRWLFDENDYVLGSLALIAGGSYRLLGGPEEFNKWMNTAEERFGRTVTENSLLAYVACERLAQDLDRSRYDAVVPHAEALSRVALKTGHTRLFQKSRLIKATALKTLSRISEAEPLFLELSQELEASEETLLLGQCLVHWGNLLSLSGRYQDALGIYKKTEAVARAAASPMTSANLFGALGECLRDQGLFDQAIEYYRASVAEYFSCGMVNWAVYTQIVLAETLLAASLPSDAMKEILAALPIIDEHELVQEGFAALALLKDAVRHRTMDSNALRELREGLHGKRWE